MDESEKNPCKTVSKSDVTARVQVMAEIRTWWFQQLEETNCRTFNKNKL